VWVCFLFDARGVHDDFLPPFKSICLKRTELGNNISCFWITKSNFTRSLWQFRQKFDVYRFPTTVFVWFGTVWLLAIPKTQRGTRSESNDESKKSKRALIAVPEWDYLDWISCRVNFSSMITHAPFVNVIKRIFIWVKVKSTYKSSRNPSALIGG